MNSKLQKFKFSDKLLSSIKILYPNILLINSWYQIFCNECGNPTFIILVCRDYYIYIFALYRCYQGIYE